MPNRRSKCVRVRVCRNVRVRVCVCVCVCEGESKRERSRERSQTREVRKTRVAHLRHAHLPPLCRRSSRRASPPAPPSSPLRSQAPPRLHPCSRRCALRWRSLARRRRGRAGGRSCSLRLRRAREREGRETRDERRGMPNRRSKCVRVRVCRNVRVRVYESERWERRETGDGE